MATYNGDVWVYFNGVAPISFGSNVTITDNNPGSNSFDQPEVVNANTASTFLVDDIGGIVGSIVIDGVVCPIVSETSDGSQSLAEDGLYLLTPVGFFTANDLPADLSAATTASAPECFLEGTHIETPDGAVPVQSLEIGDLVVTSDGRHVPVRWLGRHSVFTAFRPPERVMPVRIRSGALGDGVPKRDLIVTADHALVFDNLLVNAGALVNGSSIDRVSLSEFEDGTYTVYHVETENHDVILAEGAAAETFIDYRGRRAFDNYGEFVALYGEEKTIREMDHPRISAARLVPPALRARLAGDDKAA